MSHGRRSGDPFGRVRSALERWRRGRRHGEAIPTDLWKAAAELAEKHGVSRTSHELRLEYYALKSWVDDTVSKGAAKAGGGKSFVELPVLSGPEPECVLEFADASGKRLRLEFRGRSADQVATVARALWEAPA